METYKINVRFYFDGIFKVKANSREEAREKVQEFGGMRVGEIQDGGCNDLEDWHFPVWGDKRVYKRKKEV